VSTGAPQQPLGNFTQEQRKDAIALKYLELARAELLERIKVSYQTLIVYAGAVGAVAAWAYPNQVAQGGSGSINAWSANPRLVPPGVIVGFLAVVANWVIHHNEHIVNALARYQIYTLAKHLHDAAFPELNLWERSRPLQADNRIRVRWDFGIRSALVSLPAFIGSVLQSLDQQNCESWIWLALAWILTFVSVLLGILTVRARQRLRDEAATLQT